MGFFNEYPYTDFHEINLDWILRQMMKLHKDWNEFRAVNTITNAGAWDITKQYQAWTIVSDNNAGYISLQPVPAGVAISNTDYWGLVADYDILITDLSDRISTLEGQMASVQSELEDLTANKVIMIGDSYGALTVNWIDTLKGLVGPANCYSSAMGGRGFGTSGTNFADMLQTLVESISDPEKVSDVIVCGGANDYSPTVTNQEVIDGIADFCTYAAQHLPNAKVYIGFIGNTKHSYGGYDRLIEVLNIYKSRAAVNAAVYLTGVEYSNLNMNNLSDQTHPNAAQSRAIAYAVYQSWKGGNYTIAESEVVVAHMTDLNSASISFNQLLEGDNIYITAPQIVFNHPAKTAAQYAAGFKVATLNDDGMFHPCEYGFGVFTQALIKDTVSNTQINSMVHLGFLPNGDVTIQCYGVPANGNFTQAILVNSEIVVPAFR